MIFATPQKISDVERQLAEIKRTYGDLDVVIFAAEIIGRRINGDAITRSGWVPLQLRVGMVQNDRYASANIVKAEG